MLKTIKILLITAIYLGLLGIFWNTVSADESYVESRKLLENGNGILALRQADKSIEKNTSEPRYYYNRAKILLATNKGDRKEAALKDLNQAYMLNPRNLVTLRNMVPIYYLLSLENLELPEKLDPEYIKEAREYYSLVSKAAGNDVGVYTLLYKYETKLGLYEMAQQSKEKIIELRPDLLDWYITD